MLYQNAELGSVVQCEKNFYYKFTVEFINE